MTRQCVLGALLAALALPAAVAQPPGPPVVEVGFWEVHVYIADGIDAEGKLKVLIWRTQETEPAKSDPKTGEPLTPPQHKIVKDHQTYPLTGIKIITGAGKAVTVPEARKLLAKPTPVVTVRGPRPPAPALKLFKKDALIFLIAPEPPDKAGGAAGVPQDKDGPPPPGGRLSYGDWDFDLRFANGFDDMGNLKTVAWALFQDPPRLEFDEKTGKPQAVPRPGKVVEQTRTQEIQPEMIYNGAGKKVSPAAARKALAKTTPVLLLFSGKLAPACHSVLDPDALIFVLSGQEKK